MKAEKLIFALQDLVGNDFRINIEYTQQRKCLCGSCWVYRATASDIDDNFTYLEGDTFYDLLESLEDFRNKIPSSGIIPYEMRENKSE